MRLISLLVPIALVAACSSAASSSAPVSTAVIATAVPTSAAASDAAPSADVASAAAPAATATPTPGEPTPTPDVGATRTDAAGIAQVWVPAGTFTMGTDAEAIAAIEAQTPPPWVRQEFPSEQPDHAVTLTTGYWIDTNEVTNAAFDAFVAAGGYTTEAYWSKPGWNWVSHRDASTLPKTCPGDGPELPRRCITWWEAEAYAAWRGGALPTEAQWEYAARGPESSVYPWGDEWDPAKANVVDSTGAVAVGSYPDGASWVGAQDMAGNAMEWVNDWLAVDYYQDSPANDPTGPDSGRVKVEKGGWWGSNPFVARSAYRHYEDPPTYGDEHIGFRVATP
jgi:formylglycine-generating enzyme required for sulfatase activity